MSSTLIKRVALVTGSGKKRVGWHVADELARHGFNVAIHYRTSDADAAEAVRRLRSRGVEAEAFRADISNECEVRELVGAVHRRFERLDVLVNCAAIYKPKPLQAVTSADVLHSFEINLLGTFLCAQQSGLAMVRQPEGGCIVNFGDWAVVRPYLNYAAYFLSKGAIPALTSCLAVELAARNPRVRVNCVLPGPVLFPPDMPQAERNEAIGSTLVKRQGRPENVAAAVLFFVNNDFVTGVCLPVDGGRTIFAGDIRVSASDPANRPAGFSADQLAGEKPCPTTST
jgi:pteridine reductase